MGLLNKFFGKRRFEEEEAVIKALESAETAKESDSDDSDIEDLEKLWLERRKGARVVEEKEELEKDAKETLGEREAEEEGGPEEEEQEQEQEQKQEGEEGISEDELISSLKGVDKKEEEEEMDLVIREVMEEMGDVSAKEILELGREILNNMRGGRR